MKGTPETPRCGFSRQIVEILQSNSIPFKSFDILSDEEVRNNIKILYDWPTFPQLYHNGNLIGGLDIVKDMVESGTLSTDLAVENSGVSLEDRLKSLITSSPVMLFMKGTPETPKCGFSRTAVEILKENDINFGYFNILTDDEIRQGLKTYSDWPTYPQIYSNGTLIGGLDILKEMKESGNLKEQLGL
jgi:Grx4 family monothiol glutaredoxin